MFWDLNLVSAVKDISLQPDIVHHSSALTKHLPKILLREQFDRLIIMMGEMSELV